MKKIIKTIIASAMAAITAFSVNLPIAADDAGSGKNVNEMTALEIAKDMGAGWNLGNGLDSKGGETNWGNPMASQALIDKVASSGIKTLRVPCTWYDKCDSNGNIRQDWMARVKEVVDYGIKNDMYVILNLHHEDYDLGNDGWLRPDAENKERGLKMINKLWTQIASEFKDYDRHLIFETLNEPRLVGSGEEWTGGSYTTNQIINEFNNEAVKTIRGTGGNNATRLIMCPPSAAKLDGIDLGYEVPSGDNIAVSIHNYSPYSFALDPGGTAYWGSSSDKEALKGEIVRLYEKYVSKGIPVIIGEMGATSKGNDAVREDWAYFYASTAMIYGIPCVLWDNNSAGTGGEKFQFIDRNSLNWTALGIVENLVKGAKDGLTMTPDDISTEGGEGGNKPSGEVTAYDNVISSLTVSGVGWLQLIKIDMANIKGMFTDDCMVVIDYTGSCAPCLCFQRWSIDEWNQFDNPDKVENGRAYYYFSSFKNKMKSTFDEQEQMLVYGVEGYTTINQVTISYPKKIGDVNIDTKVDKIDSAMIVKMVMGTIGFTDEQNTLGDFNNDGKVDLRDAISILAA